MAQFIIILETILYLSSVWTVGFVFKEMLLPPIIGEIMVGVILGPNVLNIVPFIDDDEETSLFSVLGVIGITLLLMHSGLHVNEKKMLALGSKPFFVGILGTIIPLVCGLLAFRAIGLDWFPGAFASAIAITPASVGIAMRVLIAEKKLNTSYGQATLLAANIDDLISIIMFIILKNTRDEIDAIDTGVPIIMAFVFVGVFILIVRYVPSHIVKRIRRCKSTSFHRRDQVQMAMMMVLLIGCGTIGHYIGSELLGAFLIGYFFSKIPRSMLLWRMYFKPFMSWLLRFFFAASIAFNIPIKDMMTGEAIWKGTIIAIVCVISKLLATLHMGTNKWLIGWAITNRGEFSYLIAEFSLQEEIITEKTYAVIVWGLVLSTFLSPIVLKKLISRNDYQHPCGYNGKYLMTIEGHHHEGILHEIYSTITIMGLEIGDTDAKTDNISNTDIDHIIIYSACNKISIDENLLGELKDNIFDAVGGSAVHITFEKVDEISCGKLKIEIMGKLEGLKGLIMVALENHNITFIEKYRHIDDEDGFDTFTILGNEIIQRSEKTEIENRIIEICSVDESIQVVVELLDNDNQQFATINELETMV